MEDARTILLLRGACAVAAALIGCGEPDAEPGSTDPTPRAAKGAEGASAVEAAKARAAELERLEEEARAAIRAGDPAEAARRVERGLALAAGTDAADELARGRFVLLRGDLSRDAGRTVDALRDYADAMALFRVRADDPGRFQVFLSEAALEEAHGDYAAAERQLAEAEVLLPKVDDERLRADYRRRLGRLAFARARYADAAALFVDAIRLFEGAQAKLDRAETLLLLASAQDGNGEPQLARRSLDKALALFSELDDKDGEVRALHRLAGFADRDGQYAKERSLLTKVRALYDELGRRSDAVKVERQLASLPEQ